MTPARKKALEWFFDRGEVRIFDRSAPSFRMRQQMVRDGHLASMGYENMNVIGYTLTDAGRRALNGE